MLDTRLTHDKNKMGREHISGNRINWDYLYSVIRVQYGGVGDFQHNVLKKDHSYFNKIRKGLTSYCIPELEKTVSTLNINQSVLFPELADAPEAEAKAEQEKPFDIADLESDFEKSVRKQLEEINTKLDMVLELESKVNLINLNIANLMERIPKQDMAKAAEDVLMEFVQRRGRGGRACEFKLYMEELERHDIPRSYARNALDRAGATLESTGYGKDKTMWVIMPGGDKDA